VGFKLCIGHRREFMCLVKAMLATDVYPDFIVIDGKEGGKGAAPLEFANHMGMPLIEGLTFVHNTLRGANIRDRIQLDASGKLVSAFDIAKAMSLGADWAKFRARLHVLARLYPVAILSHEPLSGGGRHTGCLSRARRERAGQGAPCGKLSWQHA
jgi:glutamate synthase domain-containing protein 2